MCIIPKTPTLQQRVEAALLELGTSPEEIRQTLVREGVTGRIGCFLRCVLAKWLWRKLAPSVAIREIIVAGQIAFVSDGDGEVTCVLSAACQRFLPRFDAGLYPELVSR